VFFGRHVSIDVLEGGRGESAVRVRTFVRPRLLFEVAAAIGRGHGVSTVFIFKMTRRESSLNDLLEGALRLEDIVTVFATVNYRLCLLAR
jgi:hypothetical protein